MMTMRGKNGRDIRGFGVLYEDIQGDVKKILESITGMKENIARIPAIESDVENIESNIKAVKAALTATNQDILELKQRVSYLEAA